MSLLILLFGSSSSLKALQFIYLSAKVYVYSIQQSFMHQSPPAPVASNIFYLKYLLDMYICTTDKNQTSHHFSFACHPCFYSTSLLNVSIIYSSVPHHLISVLTLCQCCQQQQGEAGWRCVPSSLSGKQGWRYPTAEEWSHYSVPPNMDTHR